jgi:putative two-component system hydrogenase maturation factor HypX/HoxX
MRILLLTRSFNSLTQRLFVDLAERGHDLAVEYDIADSVTEEAVRLFAPDVVIASFMKRAIPERVWREHLCLVVHPGIVGDRGPSALDWAIRDGEREWGVTVLQAEADMDAGPIWAAQTFAMRAGRKSSLYRNEATEAASRAVLEALGHLASGGFRPTPLAEVRNARGRLRPAMTDADRRIDWLRDDTATVLAKIRASDGVPGVLDTLFGVPCRLYDACEEPGDVPVALPGDVIARRDDALLRRTRDGAVWIGHVKRLDREHTFKLPVGLAFAPQFPALPSRPVALDADTGGYRELRYTEAGGVGYLHFASNNGAMSTAQCERLLAAYHHALTRPTRVLVLMGGPDFWSNGIHLNVIEAADSPADESWRNINAIDDVTEAIIRTTDRLVVAAMQGNAGAGGVFMALAADEVWARQGVLLNPHYKNMGNLYGSEYWTYLLPRRVKSGPPQAVMQQRLPVSAGRARSIGLVDAVLATDPTQFLSDVRDRAAALASDPALVHRVAEKRARRAADEAAKPLAAYRDAELAEMRRNFYGFDPSYHVARANFIHKVPPSWTPRHLAVHREPRRIAKESG